MTVNKAMMRDAHTHINSCCLNDHTPFFIFKYHKRFFFLKDSKAVKFSSYFYLKQIQQKIFENTNQNKHKKFIQNKILIAFLPIKTEKSIQAIHKFLTIHNLKIFKEKFHLINSVRSSDHKK